MLLKELGQGFKFRTREKIMKSELMIDFNVRIQVPSIGLNSYTPLSSGKFKITQEAD